MAELTDVYGKRYHKETWFVDAHNALENLQMQQQPLAVQVTKRKRHVIIADETGEPITAPIDLGNSLVTPQEDGRYTWEKKEPEETDN